MELTQLIIKFIEKFEKNSNILPKILITTYIATLISPESMRQVILYNIKLSHIQLWSISLFHISILVFIVFILTSIGGLISLLTYLSDERQQFENISYTCFYFLNIMTWLFLIFSYALRINPNEYFENIIQLYESTSPILNFFIISAICWFFFIFVLENFKLLLIILKNIIQSNNSIGVRFLLFWIYVIFLQFTINYIVELHLSL